MKFHVTKIEASERLHIMARAEGPDGMVGDAIFDIGPGEVAFGWSYKELIEHGPGMVEMRGSEEDDTEASDT